MRLVRVSVRTNLEPVTEERDQSARAADEDAAHAFLREPLMHFLLLGALLFVAHRLFVADRHAERHVVVPRALAGELAGEFRARAGREPNPAELSAAIERWKRDEVAYREGLRLGLDKNDPVVRERVANKLREVESKLAPREPTDAELDAWLIAHRDRYDTPSRFDFEHYFVSKRASDAEGRARRILTELVEGRTPDDVGEAFGEGRQLIGRSESDVRRVFGPAFERGLQVLEMDRWSLLESEAGFHAVRLQGRVPRRVATRDGQRAELVRDFLAAEREEGESRALQALVDSYVFEEER
jgi:hypothetical protein